MPNILGKVNVARGVRGGIKGGKILGRPSGAGVGAVTAVDPAQLVQTAIAAGAGPAQGPKGATGATGAVGASGGPGATGATGAGASDAWGGILVTGETPGPIPIASGDGQFIGVPA